MDKDKRIKDRTEPIRAFLRAGFNVKLWGNGWDAMPEFKPYWHGILKNGPELRRAYSSCHAILQQNSDTLFHQRAYEAAACGAWVWFIHNPNNESVFDMPLSDKEHCHLIIRSMTEEAINMIKMSVQIKDNGWLGGPSPKFNMKDDYVARCRTILEAIK